MVLMDLVHLQDSFTVLVTQADPQHLTTFFLWLDLKVAEFKVNGSYSPDKNYSSSNVWLGFGLTSGVTRRLFEEEPNSLANGNSVGQQRTPTTPKHDVMMEALRPLSYSDTKLNALKKTGNLSIDFLMKNDISFGGLENDPQRVMLKVPNRPYQDQMLEPLDFSRTERKDFENKEGVQSLLRAVLSKSRESPKNGCYQVSQSNDVAGGSDPRSPANSDAVSEDLTKMPEPTEKNSCPYCSKTFQYRSSYRRHVKIHQGIFSHVCYVCNRKFTRKEHFVRHKCNRRPNKPNRGNDSMASEMSSETEYLTSASQNDSINVIVGEQRAVIKVEPENENENLDESFNNLEPNEDDEDFSRTFESRRKSSTPRKFVAADEDEPDDVVSDSETCYQMKQEGLELGESEATNGIMIKQENIENGSVNDYISGSSDNHLLAESEGIRMPEMHYGDPSFFDLQTGSYKVSSENDELNNANKSGVITIKKQAKYLKLRNEAHIVDGNLCFSCPHCFKTFHRSSNFSRHMRIHRGIYSYICQSCNRGFFRREHFQKHKCNRKSISQVCDRQTKFELLHQNRKDMADESIPVNARELLPEWSSSNFHCRSDDSKVVVSLLPAMLKTL